MGTNVRILGRGKDVNITKQTEASGDMTTERGGRNTTTNGRQAMALRRAARRWLRGFAVHNMQTVPYY